MLVSGGGGGSCFLGCAHVRVSVCAHVGAHVCVQMCVCVCVCTCVHVWYRSLTYFLSFLSLVSRIETRERVYNFILWV